MNGNGKDFLKAAKELAELRGITLDEIFTDIETALNAAYKRNYGASNSKVILGTNDGTVNKTPPTIIGETYG